MKKELKGVRNWFLYFIRTFKKGDCLTKLCFFIMGSSNLLRGQIAKGLAFLAAEIFYLYYLITIGLSSLAGLATLGTKQQGMVMDEELGIFVVQQGDNSMLMLLSGVVSLFLTALFLVIWRASIKAGYEAQQIKEQGKRLPGLLEDICTYFDSKIHRTLMALPLTGILLFTVLPLFFMILIAFTNYDHEHQPPGNLFTWIGLANFKTILLSGDTISKTFWPVLGWTIIWAVFATLLNYLGGILLALLINRKETKCKGLWRTLFVISIAIPQFVSLLVVRTMLNNDGAVNALLRELGIIADTAFVPFLSNPSWARITVILVNLWVGIPYTMLITTGILSNIPGDLYDSARVDGANQVVIFFKITMPYVVFVTTPYLITQFIGNINNFNVIYFLTGGGPISLDYYQAGKTDLLVTWLYKLTTGTKKDYSYASAIGILVFILSAVFSLISYRRTASYNREEDFQ
ncbi:sugar ABC transporter permease [Anaerocolumna cellulosilytica]|uniref:Maltose/maltodextrin transport system permease protein n=1 Tax=Anaerocolumna cellulosilytica TaxID=433286 RepID=A0A6S6QS59_9FIRM|nr:arabinogalactan oligomer/maltooligosaccharide transport system permease protein [Anaerocolumna cellulosilytica]BCJ92466.1 sugar ABC transporter permease [Anaerocolumna cellulosilytica]